MNLEYIVMRYIADIIEHEREEDIIDIPESEYTVEDVQLLEIIEN